MKLNELLKKPVALITENNIVRDILTADNTALDLLNKLNEYQSSWEDLFIVYLNKETSKPEAILKFEDFNKILDLFGVINKKGQSFLNVKLASMNLPTEFPVKRDQLLSRTDLVEKAVKIFSNEKEKTNVLTVVDDNGSYMGKVRRSTLSSKINELAK